MKKITCLFVLTILVFSGFGLQAMIQEKPTGKSKKKLLRRIAPHILRATIQGDIDFNNPEINISEEDVIYLGSVDISS